MQFITLSPLFSLKCKVCVYSGAPFVINCTPVLMINKGVNYGTNLLWIKHDL